MAKNITKDKKGNLLLKYSLHVVYDNSKPECIQ